MAAEGVHITQFVAFLLMSMTARGSVDCLTEQEFRDENYTTMKDNHVKNMLDREKNIFFRYLYYYGSDRNGFAIEEPKFDMPSAFLGGTLIKRIPFDNNKVGDIENEVRVMRELCAGEKANLSTQRTCENDFVADFYGCGIDNKAAYLFVRRPLIPNYTFLKKSAFLNKPYLDRVLMMLDIIDLFIGLHKMEYVHGDIKPENILGSCQTREFKMIGFRYTNKVGKDFLGGAGPYHAPERRLKGSKATVLTVQEDIYSLAMTLLKLDGSFTTEEDLIPKICFDKKKSWSECKVDYETNLKTVFVKEHLLSSLFPIFKKALSFNPADRYETPEKLSADILEELRKLEGAKKSVEEALNEALKNSPNGEPSDSWRCKTLTKNFVSNSFTGVFKNNYIKNEKFQERCEAKKNKVVAANGNTKQHI